MQKTLIYSHRSQHVNLTLMYTATPFCCDIWACLVHETHRPSFPNLQIRLGLCSTLHLKELLAVEESHLPTRQTEHTLLFGDIGVYRDCVCVVDNSAGEWVFRGKRFLRKMANRKVSGTYEFLSHCIDDGQIETPIWWVSMNCKCGGQPSVDGRPRESTACSQPRKKTQHCGVLLWPPTT